MIKALEERMGSDALPGQRIQGTTKSFGKDTGGLPTGLENRHWLRPREFAELYGLSLKHVYSILARRLLPATKRKGCGWLIDRRKFEAELQAGTKAEIERVQ